MRFLTNCFRKIKRFATLLALLVACKSYGQTLIPISWEDIVNAEQTANGIQSTAKPGWNSGATSKNCLYPHQSGALEYTVTDASKIQAFGFSVTPNIGHRPQHIEYLLQFRDDGLLRIKERGQLLKKTTFSEGDKVRIERAGNSMQFYRNEELLQQVQVDPAEQLVAHVAMYSEEAGFDGLRMTGPYFLIKPNITISSNRDYFEEKGSAAVQPLVNELPYSVSWQPNNSTLTSIDNLSTGDYTVTITDNAGHTLTYTIGVGNSLFWENQVGVDTTSTTDTLVKTSVGSGWKGASSLNQLAANKNGWLEYTVQSRDQNKAFGFDTIVPDTAFSPRANQMLYGFQFKESGVLLAREKRNSTNIGSYEIGDVLRLERVGGEVRYLRNGRVLRTIDAVPANTLVARASIKTPGGRFYGLRASFLPPKFSVKTIVENVSKSRPYSSAEIKVAGGVPPYTFSWTNGDTTAFSDSLQVGGHKVNITDGWGNVIKHSFVVNYNVSFGDKRGVKVQDGTLTKTAFDNEWGNAGAYGEDVIASGESGSVSFAIENPEADLFVGFSSGYGGFHYEDQSYAIVVQNGTLHSWDGAALSILTAPWALAEIPIVAGDVLKLERRTIAGSPTISWSHNGVIYQNTTAVEPNAELIPVAGIKERGGSLSNVIGEFTPDKDPTFFCNTNNSDRNYVRHASFDEQGNEVSQSVGFIDAFGRMSQTQSKDYVNNNVLATAPLYDEWGRTVGVTLPAPIFKTDAACFKANFITNSRGEPYSYRDFDNRSLPQGVDGSSNNPEPVGQAVKGSVGWYYSNNNSDEAYVPADSWPYSRVDFWEDSRGNIKRSGGVGMHHKLGSGHESVAFTLSSTYELTHVFGRESQQAIKTVVRDAQGAISVVYRDQAGKVRASAVSGISSNCASQTAVHRVHYNLPTADLHIPNGEVELILALDYTKRANELSDIVLKIFDLESDEQLQLGADYSITMLDPATDPGKYAITLLGNYANGHRFLRFTYKYTNAFFADFYTHFAHNINPPDIHISQQLDYSRWTLNYFDHKAGLITKTIQPNGVDCQSYDPGIPETITNVYKGEEVRPNGQYVQNIPGQVLIEIGTADLPNPNDIIQTFRFGISSVPQDPEQDDTGILVYSPCDGQLTGYFQPTNDPTLNMGAGEDWKYTADYMSEAPIAASLNPGKPDPIKELNNGAKSFTEISPPWDPDKICLGHCYNNQYDPECGETAIDVGGDCPVDACAGIPPTRVATFRYEIQLFGVDDQGVATQVNLDGSETNPTSVFFYPVLMKTCACTYFWDQFSLETFEGYFGPQFFSSINQNFETVEFRLASIAVQEGQASGFSAFNPNTNNYHDFAQYMNFIVDGTYRNTEPATQPSHNGFENTYSYSEEYRIEAVERVDEGRTESVYDEQGQLRFSQDAVQSQTQLFSYSNYDVLGRVVETGEYDYSTDLAQQPLPIYFQNYGGDLAVPQGYSDVFSVVDASDGLVDAYCQNRHSYLYDVEALDFPITLYPNEKQTFLNGQLSRTENEHTITWFSYDEYGRLRFTIQQIKNMNGVGQPAHKTMHYTYNFLGNLLQTVYQQGDTAEAFYHHYTYDANQRLRQVHTSLDGTVLNQEIQAAYEYSLHGAMDRMELGDEVQGIDYVYTIAGRLKSINNPALNERDPGQDGFTGPHATFAQDVFGMTIDYHEDDYRRQGTNIQTYVEPIPGGNKEGLYDGNIRSIRWQTRTIGINPTGNAPLYEEEQLIYTYDYDELGQLAQSRFGRTSSNGSLNSNAPQGVAQAGPTAAMLPDYKVSNLSYDDNGNLQSLSRSGNSFSGLDMDELSYTYLSGKNQLDHVNDAGPASNYATDIEDQSNGNYTYNAKGQLVADVAGQNFFKYNHFGKVTHIYSDAACTQLKVTFDYSASGSRLRKTNYISNQPDQVVWYIRDAGGALIATYESDAAASTLVLTDLTIYGSSRIGFYNRVDDEARFEITDHLGNVRATIKGELLANGDVELLSLEDFYPFGMPMPGQTIASDHRFGYQGQETDDETGFVSFELRQYDPRIGRWLSTDPYRQHHSPYLAMSNNPVLFIDPDGGLSTEGNLEDHDHDGSGWTINHLWMSINFQGDAEELNQFWKEHFGIWYDEDEGWVTSIKDQIEWSITGHARQRKFEKGDPFRTNDIDATVDGYQVNGVLIPEYEKLSKADFDQYFWNQTMGAYLNGRGEGMASAIEGTFQLILGSFKGENDDALIDLFAASFMPNSERSKAANDRLLAQLEAGIDKIASGNITYGEIGQAEGYIATTVAGGYGAAQLMPGLVGGINRLVAGGARICFVEGTLVWAANQSKIPIENVSVGTQVWSYNELYGTTELQIVSKTFVSETSQLIRLVIDGELILVTPEHPFFIDGDWVAAQNLVVGDNVRLYGENETVARNNGEIVQNSVVEFATIEQVTYIDTVATVYNFEVAENHNYYVSELGVLVHNTCPSPASSARSWQAANYGNVDRWRNITLKDGTLVVGGLPGQSNYYTTINGLSRSGLTAKGYSQGLQVLPHEVYGFRPQAGVYQVVGDSRAAFGTTYANTIGGAGGLPQIYIPHYGNLKLIKTIELK